MGITVSEIIDATGRQTDARTDSKPNKILFYTKPGKKIQSLLCGITYAENIKCAVSTYCPDCKDELILRITDSFQQLHTNTYSE